MRCLAETLSAASQADEVSRAVSTFRSSLRGLHDCPSRETLKLLLSVHVVADLVAQGCKLEIAEKSITLSYDGLNTNIDAAKAAVRRRHLVERDSQLSESAVTAFIHGMEQRRLTATG